MLPLKGFLNELEINELKRRNKHTYQLTYTYLLEYIVVFMIAAVIFLGVGYFIDTLSNFYYVFLSFISTILITYRVIKLKYEQNVVKVFKQKFNPKWIVNLDLLYIVTVYFISQSIYLFLFYRDYLGILFLLIISSTALVLLVLFVTLHIKFKLTRQINLQTQLLYHIGFIFILSMSINYTLPINHIELSYIISQIIIMMIYMVKIAMKEIFKLKSYQTRSVTGFIMTLFFMMFLTSTLLMNRGSIIKPFDLVVYDVSKEYKIELTKSNYAFYSHEITPGYYLYDDDLYNEDLEVVYTFNRNSSVFNIDDEIYYSIGAYDMTSSYRIYYHIYKVSNDFSESTFVFDTTSSPSENIFFKYNFNFYTLNKEEALNHDTSKFAYRAELGMGNYYYPIDKNEGHILSSSKKYVIIYKNDAFLYLPSDYHYLDIDTNASYLYHDGWMLKVDNDTKQLSINTAISYASGIEGNDIILDDKIGSEEIEGFKSGTFGFVIYQKQEGQFIFDYYTLSGQPYLHHAIESYDQLGISVNLYDGHFTVYNTNAYYEMPYAQGVSMVKRLGIPLYTISQIIIISLIFIVTLNEPGFLYDRGGLS